MRHTAISSLELTRTNLKIRPEGHLLANLDDVSDVGVVEEALEVQDENRWQGLDELLSTGFDDNPRASGNCDLDRMRIRDEGQGILDCMDLLALYTVVSIADRSLRKVS